MNRFKYIAILALCLLATAADAWATEYESLTFVYADGTQVSFSVNGLTITYDDYAHAVVTNDDTTATLDLAGMQYMCFSGQTTTVTGDVNGDGEVNIADVNALIDIILGGHDDTGGRADVNGDGEVNIADVNAVIDLILNQ